jgi:hypothetical protein
MPTRAAVHETTTVSRGVQFVSRLPIYHTQALAKRDKMWCSRVPVTTIRG